MITRYELKYKLNNEKNKRVREIKRGERITNPVIIQLIIIIGLIN